jgi:TonB family protein
MQRTRNDSGLAALHASKGLPGHILDVVALTTDAGLLATLREASGPEHALWHAKSADAAVDLLVGGRCGILIVDLSALRGDAAALLDRLHSQFPELILLATGRRGEEQAVAALVGDGRVYRFLHKPVSPARASLFIATATRRYHELRNVQPLMLTTVKTIAARPGFNRAMAVIFAVIAAVAVFFGWQAMEGDEPQLAQPAQPPAPNPRAVQEQVIALLAQAQAAIDADRLMEPASDNAVTYLRRVLVLDPTNAEARASLDGIVAALEARVDAALQAEDPPAGAAAFRILQQAAPNHPRLDELSQQLMALARARVADPAPAETDATIAESDASPKTAAGERPTVDPSPPRKPTPATAAPRDPTAEDVATLTQLRERGILIEPAADNAYDRLVQLRGRYPGSAEIAAEQQQLVVALLERARMAVTSGDTVSALALLDRVDLLSPGLDAARSLRQQLTAARVQAEALASVISAAEFRRTREVQPDYPRGARRNGIEGFVDLEFTIAMDGTTRDIVVAGAQPAKVFDNAAIDALSQWRFEPIVKEGIPVSQRAVLRMQFVIPD